MSISSVDRFNTVEEFWQELTSPIPKQQVDTPRLKSLAPAQQQVVHEQQLKRLTTSPPALHHQTHDPKSRKQRGFLPILLAIILAVAIGTALLTIVLRHNSTPTLAPSTPQSTVTPATSPPSTLTTGVSAYPDIVPSYAGTVLDLMNSQKTDMFLTQIHQNGGSISGYFRGLGLVGPFTGTVTPTGHLQFTVQAGASTLLFEGEIKIGGDIQGTFEALNQQRQHTGESGSWNVSANQ
jgi:hypothetical protein